MKKDHYSPSPVDTSTIDLPHNLRDLVERLAENVHENWAKKRIDEGWQYGKTVDSVLKTTPYLIPYSELPESEKEYNRKTAMETIKLLINMGYIIKEK